MKTEIIHRNRPMTDADRERAMLVSPKEYPQDLPCAICHHRWMQHKGTLCPVSPGYIERDGGIKLPVFAGSNSTFVPDLAYLNQSPDFDVA